VAKRAQIAAAIAQMAPVPGDVPSNLEAVLRLHRQAVAEGAELVVFPELALTGFHLGEDHDEHALELEDEQFGRLLEASQEAALAVGFIERSPRGRIYNSVALLDEGEVVHIHRKVYLVNYSIWDEKKHYSRGKRLEVFSWRGFRVALYVCYDFWYPSMQHLAASDDADLFIVSANSAVDFAGYNPHIWEMLTRVPAILYGAWILFCNRVGKEADLHFWGGSSIVAPFGMSRFVAGPHEEVLHHVLDRARVDRARKALPLLRDADMDFTLEELRQIRDRRNREND